MASASQPAVQRGILYTLGNVCRRNSREIKVALVSLLILGILAAAVVLGIHYGMGFEAFNKWATELKYGAYIGLGAGTGAMLLAGGVVAVVNKLFKPPQIDDPEYSSQWNSEKRSYRTQFTPVQN